MALVCYAARGLKILALFVLFFQALQFDNASQPHALFGHKTKFEAELRPQTTQQNDAKTASHTHTHYRLCFWTRLKQKRIDVRFWNRRWAQKSPSHDEMLSTLNRACPTFACRSIVASSIRFDREIRDVVQQMPQLKGQEVQGSKGIPIQHMHVYIM